VPRPQRPVAKAQPEDRDAEGPFEDHGAERGHRRTECRANPNLASSSVKRLFPPAAMTVLDTYESLFES